MDYEHYYFLMHAFDRLGRRMFPDDWTGNEIHTSNLRSPDEIEKELEPYVKESKALEARFNELNGIIDKTFKDDLIKECEIEKVEIGIRRAELSSKFWDIGKPDDSYRKTYAAIPRKETVLNELLSALRTRKIQATMNGGVVIQFDYLENMPGFKLDVEHSLARMPKTEYGGRGNHASVLLIRNRFDEWLDVHHPPKAPPGTREEKIQLCKRWLREQKLLDNRLRKKPFIELAKINFRISEYAAEQIWAELAGDWKNPGRPKNTKK